MGLVLSVAALILAWSFGRRSLGAGMVVVLVVGYFYGFLRAQIHDGFSHFAFDAAVLGLYLARFAQPGALRPRPENRGLYNWTLLLLGWPVLMMGLWFVFPIHPLIQLVGLRAAVWFVPVLLLGATARADDLVAITRAMAVLNLVALLFATGEYFLGLEPFFPHNAVTKIMYDSNDIADYRFNRIPATFLAAAAYGGVMVATVPWLTARLQMPRVAFPEKVLMATALFAAALGVFMCGSRTPVVFLFVLGAFIAWHFRARARYLIPALMIAVVVYYFVTGSERLQRFMTLQDTDYVASRIEGSVHVHILDLFVEYPLGAGLGSGWGTSIPSWLQEYAPQPIGAENEFARIGVEQGLVGLALWVSFLIWFFSRRRPRMVPEWALGSRLMFVSVCLCWCNALLGAGLLAAIPGTVLMLFQMGLLARDAPAAVPARRLGDPRAVSETNTVPAVSVAGGP
jgi:hypothetical protein